MSAPRPRGNRRTVVLLAIAVLVALALYGRGAGKTVSVSAHDSGRTIRLAKRDTLRVILAEAAGTGYRWSFALRPSARVLELESSKYYPTPRSGAAAGTRGALVMTFTTLAAGATSLALLYQGPGRHGRIAGHFKLTITPG